MKIVRIIARLNTGGPARHVVWLTKELNNGEFQSALLAGTIPEGEGDMNYFAAQNNVTPIYIEEMSRELSPKDVISLFKIYKIIKRVKPDIIHTHTAKAGTVGRIAAFIYRWITPRTLIGKPRRVGVVHTFHGHVFHSYYGKLKTRVFLTIEQALALITDKILVLSEQQKREINEQFGVGRKSQFQIVPLGIDLEQFSRWREKRSVLRGELNAADDEILIGLVGRLTEIKNHKLFLEAARLWKNKYADGLPKVRFIVIGDGHLRGELTETSKKTDVADIVEFIGERSDPDIFYPALDIVALTSFNEGTPLSLIEAMANCRPIISTAVGGTIDLLGAGSTAVNDVVIGERGILVPSGNAELFCQGIKKLLTDTELSSRLTSRAETYVREKYSKSRLVNDIEELYRRLA